MMNVQDEEKGKQRQCISSGVEKEVELTYRIYDEIYQKYKKVSTLYNKKSQNLTLIAYPQLLDEICREIIEYLNIIALGIYVYDNKTNQLILEIGIDSDERRFASMSELAEEDIAVHRAYEDNLLQRYEIQQEENKKIRNLLEQTEREIRECYPVAFGEEVIGVVDICVNSEQNVEDRTKFMVSAIQKIGLLLKTSILRQGMNEELQKRVAIEEEMGLFFNATTELVCMLNCKGNFIAVGEQWQEILGWSKDELLKKRYMDLFTQEDQKELLEEAAQLKQGEIINNSVRLMNTRAGQNKWIAWNGRYISEREIYICSGRDITEQKEQEEKSRTLEQAITRESVKNEFFTNMSHEFRTPLNIILAIIQLMEKKLDDTDEEQQAISKHVPLLKQNAYRLLRLVNNVLDMAKIDTGMYSLQLKNYNIVNIVEEIVLSVAEYTKSRGIRLVFDTDVEERLLACDADKIERIMLNLLSNAVKYTEEQGLIEVKIEDGEDEITILVKDSGSGIKANKLGVIFERFRQGEQDLTRQYEGTGIGLSLVKSLIEMHEGTIEVKSKWGVGSEFIVTLPIRLIEDDQGDSDERSSFVPDHLEKCIVEFSDVYG